MTFSNLKISVVKTSVIAAALVGSLSLMGCERKDNSLNESTNERSGVASAANNDPIGMQDTTSNSGAESYSSNSGNQINSTNTDGTNTTDGMSSSSWSSSSSSVGDTSTN